MFRIVNTLDMHIYGHTRCPQAVSFDYNITILYVHIIIINNAWSSEKNHFCFLKIQHLWCKLRKTKHALISDLIIFHHPKHTSVTC